MGAAEGCGSALQVDCLEGFDTPGLHQTMGCDCHIWETAVCNSRWSAVQLCYTPPNNLWAVSANGNTSGLQPEIRGSIPRRSTKENLQRANDDKLRVHQTIHGLLV